MKNDKFNDNNDNNNNAKEVVDDRPAFATGNAVLPAEEL